jgi:hypothetical protein
VDKLKHRRPEESGKKSENYQKFALLLDNVRRKPNEIFFEYGFINRLPFKVRLKIDKKKYTWMN